MRIGLLLLISLLLVAGACSTASSNAGDGAAGADVTSLDIGLSFDTSKGDASGTDKADATGDPDIAPGTDAEVVKDVELVDTQVAQDVAPPVDIVDVPTVKDVPAKPDVQVTPDAGPPDSGSAPDVAEPECPSGIKWLLGDIWGTDLMEPGLACIACHQKKGPKFTIAGTVYPGFHTVDTCNGTASITVEITGADGQVLKLQSNSVGNFKSQTAVALPYTARVIDSNGKERKMYAEQTDGDCNICHTPAGSNGAPGRIHAP
jgi:hypothetical protein